MRERKARSTRSRRESYRVGTGDKKLKMSDLPGIVQSAIFQVHHKFLQTESIQDRGSSLPQ